MPPCTSSGIKTYRLTYLLLYYERLTFVLTLGCFFPLLQWFKVIPGNNKVRRIQEIVRKPLPRCRQSRPVEPGVVSDVFPPILSDLRPRQNVQALLLTTPDRRGEKILGAQKSLDGFFFVLLICMLSSQFNGTRCLLPTSTFPLAMSFPRRRCWAQLSMRRPRARMGMIMRILMTGSTPMVVSGRGSSFLGVLCSHVLAWHGA